MKKFISEFPEEHREVLYRLEAKHEVLKRMKWFEEYGKGGWKHDIERLEKSMSLLLSTLPADVIVDYVDFQEYRDTTCIFTKFT